MQGKIKEVKDNAEEVNPRARVFVTDSIITVDRPDLIKGKRVLLVEDGPTLTHGEMRYGAGSPPQLDSTLMPLRRCAGASCSMQGSALSGMLAA